MKILTGGRGSGKTFAMLKALEEDPAATLFCISHEQRDWLTHYVKRYNFNVNTERIRVLEVPRTLGKRLLDNVDLVFDVVSAGDFEWEKL